MTTTRTATVAVARAAYMPGSRDHDRVHAASPKHGGAILACNGRWLQHVDTWTDNADEVLAGPFACRQCLAGIASGRIIMELAR